MMIQKIPLRLAAMMLILLLLAGCGKSGEAAEQSVSSQVSASSEISTPSESSSVPTSSTPPIQSSAPESSQAIPVPSSGADSSPDNSLAESFESSSQSSGQDEGTKEGTVNPADMLTIETDQGGNTYIFHSLPQDVSEMEGLWGLQESAPEHTAAFCVAAFNRYPQSKEDCFAMIDLLRGPKPMNDMDKQFISDRFRDKDYVPRSYFAGASPDNNYTPAEPYTLTVTADAHSFDEENMARLYVSSGGADSPRPITLRKAKDGGWYLWEYSSVLLGIRLPAAEDPWA